jgi:hypothetical protein
MSATFRIDTRAGLLHAIERYSAIGATHRAILLRALYQHRIEARMH